MLSYNYYILFLIALCACTAMKNLERPDVSSLHEGYFFKVKEGHQLFVYEYQPIKIYHSTVFIISGITGINHNSERELIELLRNGNNRVVTIHPRGTGYSEGTRGDVSDFSDFINDYIEIILSDKDYNSKQHPIILFGHSMSTAVLLAVADKLTDVGGAILVNPTYILKKTKGMSPGIGQYFKFAWYYVFQRRTPIVNMAGNPTMIKNEEDRKDSEARINDPLLVKYFSMYMMTESRKLMNAMIGYSKTANYPLLLIYGENDNIVDKKGCDLLFDSWKSERKQYVLIKDGSHGKSTVLLAKSAIWLWMESVGQVQMEK